VGELRNIDKILVGKPEGKIPFGRPRCRWEGITGMSLGKWGVKMWAGCIWLGCCEHGNGPCGSMKSREFLD
jgi:hypothetical protein